MAIKHADQALVESYYTAMRMGAAGAGALAELFSDDAVYVEPFSGGDGRPRTHPANALSASSSKTQSASVRPTWWSR